MRHFVFVLGRLDHADQPVALQGIIEHLQICLLYTSDAADERSSVDLGGRRIIKKKKKIELLFTHS